MVCSACCVTNMTMNNQLKPSKVTFEIPLELCVMWIFPPTNGLGLKKKINTAPQELLDKVSLKARKLKDTVKTWNSIEETLIMAESASLVINAKA